MAKKKRTHCKKGHEYTEENTYHYTQPSGTPGRVCKTCRRNYDRERYLDSKGYVDEERVTLLIQSRLARGYKDYGALDLDNDNRDFIKEALEEVLDMSVYIASKLIKLQRLEKTS